MTKIKYTLKNRPNLRNEKYRWDNFSTILVNTETGKTFFDDVSEWFEDFEKELREKLKGYHPMDWDAREQRLIEEILGE